MGLVNLTSPVDLLSVFLFPVAPGSDYTVSTFTGDKWGAGTDANVLIVLFGENGDSGEIQLDNSGNNFESEQ